jgi:hypothetical protein
VRPLPDSRIPKSGKVRVNDAWVPLLSAHPDTAPEKQRHPLAGLPTWTRHCSPS